MKKVISYTLIFVLVLSFGALGLTYGANSQDKLNDLNSQITDTKGQLNNGKKMENSLNNEIKNLESKINSTQAQIDALDGDIDATQAKISQALADLEKLEADMNTQNDNLNKRLRTMYKNGSVGFIDVLLGSSGISDLMTNMDRVQRIYDNDKEVLEVLKEQHQIIDAQKQYLLGLQADLKQKQSNQEAQKQSLSASKSEVTEKKSEVAKDNKALEEQLNNLNAEANRIKAEILALQSKGTTYNGGIMAWPVPGVTRISSEFGYRLHPILGYKKLHTGMDIAAPTGTTVVASNPGTVIKAAYNNSYGYMVMIDHGGGIVTLYAHNSKLLVSTGDVVSRGQAISKSGSTGDSTGPHVHFEVRVNGEYKNPRDWL
ncbi:murein hydrolase activator EnvC family protein [Clostridium aminobutyricum]|uniref:Peptidoglycan DD-metalloendopeptidase family protein n=1 Tax=Clostridium aminobutyricum TaxID=33953 RepID=A0A939D836_CLOAM|nr:peptidoglycan DD-metalloendopeptidase family protein [Clostridium aminobutyricum]MBN7772876.1 peptidoglycan DD-metalloendopeptidase family protein [Clostridium aminobutyricum]